MKNETIVRVVDSKAQAFYASILYEDNHPFAKVIEEIKETGESRIKITLYMGLIKGEKWDYLIQKACECGVYSIVPAMSSRSVVKIKEEKNDRKLERWNKIAAEACEQCKRVHQVEVSNPIELKNIQPDDSLKLIAYEDADVHGSNMAKLLINNDKNDISILIGPEGGFSKEEVKHMQSMGYQCISLGTRIFRAETAALFALNAITYHYDLLGELQ